jgi:outer membrane lipoprotein SlyB
MNGRFLRISAMALLTTLFAAGCAAPSRSGSAYTDRETRRPMEVQMGIVESVRSVTMERSQEPAAGTATGAILGGLAGSNIGGGRGQAAATVLGAVAGGVAGSYAEKGMTDRPALEITVRTDAGRLLAIVQEAGDDRFSPGQRIRILTDPRTGTARVTP